MAKTSDKVRQAKCRAKFKENIKAYKAYLEKDRLRKKLQRQKDKTKPIAEQAAHKAEERVRLRNCRIQKKKTDQPALALSLGESPYQTKQLTGKAIKRVAKSLPNSPRKKRFVIGKTAEEAGLEVKGMHRKVRTGISPEQIDAVQKFFKEDDTSWQAPGRKDKVISWEVLSNGKISKTTTQVRYMLMSLKEAYLFREQIKCEVIGLSKFCSLRPVNIKLFEQIPHNVYVNTTKTFV